MTITMTELFLFAWATLATGMWLQNRANLRFHRDMTGELLHRIAKGKVRVTMKGGELEITSVSPQDQSV